MAFALPSGSCEEWIFPKSYLEDISLPRFEKIDLKKEKDTRSKTVWFLYDLLDFTKLDRRVFEAASVFFHRFYVFHAFASHSRFEMALASAFLASKVEEKPIKMKDLLIRYYHVRFERNATEQELKELQKRVLIAERILLQTLNFDLNLTHPTFFLTKIRNLKNVIPEQARQDLYVTSQKLILDSYRTTLCLRFLPHEISTALMFLATIQLELVPNSTQSNKLPENVWFDLLQNDVEEQAIKSICFEMMEMYELRAYGQPHSKMILRDNVLEGVELLQRKPVSSHQNPQKTHSDGSLTPTQENGLSPYSSGNGQLQGREEEVVGTIKQDKIVDGFPVPPLPPLNRPRGGSFSKPVVSGATSGFTPRGTGQEVGVEATPPFNSTDNVTPSSTPGSLPPPPDSPFSELGASSIDSFSLLTNNRQGYPVNYKNPGNHDVGIFPPPTPGSLPATPSFDNLPRVGSNFALGETGGSSTTGGVAKRPRIE